MATMDAIEQAIDNSFVWGQIDILIYVLEKAPGAFFQMVLKSKGGFPEVRDALMWAYHSWCLAHNLAWAAGRP
jgi:hypothetical protein